MKDVIGIVYLIHLDEPLHHSRHYLGFAEKGNLKSRLRSHQQGSGARFLQAALEKGLSFRCVRTWRRRTREFERLLKNRKNARSLCPQCRQEWKDAQIFYREVKRFSNRTAAVSV